MKFRVIVYEGFGESHEKKFRTLEAAKKYQAKVWKQDRLPKHFVTIEQKTLMWIKI